MKHASIFLLLSVLLTAGGYSQTYSKEYDLVCYNQGRSAMCELENTTPQTLRCELILESWTTIGDFRGSKVMVRIAPGDVKEVTLEADTNYNIKSVQGFGHCN